ncbi:hypothetical protein [Photorhabdus cinerea]|nr:hypothetical protein [Photorhabdus cinerea]
MEKLLTGWAKLLGLKLKESDWNYEMHYIIFSFFCVFYMSGTG